MSKVSVQIEKNRKLEELRKEVEKEALRLQEWIDKKEEIVLQSKVLSERKTILLKGIESLNRDIENRTSVLDGLIKKEEGFISSIKQERNNEEDKLREVRSYLLISKKELSEINELLLEVKDSLKKESEAKGRLVKTRKDIENLKSEGFNILNEVNAKLSELNQRNLDLDIYKKYADDIYGKMASYVRVMNETASYVNEFLTENKVPMKFEKPDETIVVNFNNFNQKRVDT